MAGRGPIAGRSWLSWDLARRWVSYHPQRIQRHDIRRLLQSARRPAGLHGREQRLHLQPAQPGQPLRPDRPFRYRIGSSVNANNLGWFIDDVRIYTCSTTTTRKPDGRIRLGTSGAFAGNDIYNTTGASQTKTGSAGVGSTITFGISVQNDASASDSFRVQGAGSTTAYNVKYLDGATNVTAAVLAGSYQTPSLAAGASHLLTVKVKVKSGATVGSKVNRLVTIRSVADATKLDAVKFTAKRS